MGSGRAPPSRSPGGTGRRAVGLFMGLARGAAAGAAGTTALNTATYLDMLGRGRSPSSAPEATVERLADLAGTSVPGDGDAARNRTTALGALQGLAVGVAVGAILGAARSVGWKPPLPVAAVLAATAAMVVADGPMTLLGVTDPRRWSRVDWLSDAVPHLAYGLVTAATVGATDHDRRV